MPLERLPALWIEADDARGRVILDELLELLHVVFRPSLVMSLRAMWILVTANRRPVWFNVASAGREVALPASAHQNHCRVPIHYGASRRHWSTRARETQRGQAPARR